MNELSPFPVQAIAARKGPHTPIPRDASWAKGAGFVGEDYLPISEAAIPITDLGFMRADAVYDVVSVVRGRFFRLADHQDRFERSCRRMKLKRPFDRDREAGILNELVARTGLKDAFVWWCVTRGMNPANPSDRLFADRYQNRFYAFAIPYVFIKDDAGRQAGLHLHVSEDYIRIPPEAVDPRAKNFCSLDQAMSLMEAGAAGAGWSVLTDGKGYLAEAPGSNIFVVTRGDVRTPDRGCLEGITRMTVLELATELGLKVEVAPVTVDELLEAEEAFLTSSAGGILPVSTVNGRPLCQGAGPVSTRIHNLYWERIWSGWHGTPVDYRVAE